MMENRKIRTFFDERAANWDAERDPEFIQRAAAIMDELPLGRGARVLDVGSGTGVLAPMLAPKVGPEGLIVAVDVSGFMLKEAKRKHVACRVAFLQADVMDIPLYGPFFDWIICYSVFPHFTDQAHALAQLTSVLKPKGSLVVCHSQSREAINALHQSVGDVVGGHTIPDHADMTALVQNAALTLTRLHNGSDRYIMVAQK